MGLLPMAKCTGHWMQKQLRLPPLISCVCEAQSGRLLLRIPLMPLCAAAPRLPPPNTEPMGGRVGQEAEPVRAVLPGAHSQSSKGAQSYFKWLSDGFSFMHLRTRLEGRIMHIDLWIGVNMPGYKDASVCVTRIREGGEAKSASQKASPHTNLILAW